jgi:hypothetical protein
MPSVRIRLTEAALRAVDSFAGKGGREEFIRIAIVRRSLTPKRLAPGRHMSFSRTPNRKPMIGRFNGMSRRNHYYAIPSMAVGVSLKMLRAVWF